MFTDTPENYSQRLKDLPQKIAAALEAVDASGAISDAQMSLIAATAAELDELLHWRVYNDSYSRSSAWLFRDYLALNSDQARFAALALPLLPAMKTSAVAEAFQAYCDMVGRRRIQNSYIASWLQENPPSASQS